MYFVLRAGYQFAWISLHVCFSRVASDSEIILITSSWNIVSIQSKHSISTLFYPFHVLPFFSNVVFLSLAAYIDMPTFNSLYIADFNEKYDVDHDGYLNLVSTTRIPWNTVILVGS